MAATLKLDTITHPSNASTANITLDDAGNATVGNTLAMGSSFKRNRIINGDMRIDQRNAGASVTPTNAQYTVDRWYGWCSQASKYSVQQNAGSVTPPAGFSNYLGVTSSSAFSVQSGDYFGIVQPVEGFNVADLAWGTANAKTITISFWVYSSLTGTFGGAVQNNAQNRGYPFTYTIGSTQANQWIYQTVTIPGDTNTGATWVTNNGVGLRLAFGLGVGSTYSGTAGSWQGANIVSASDATSIVGTNGATFYITGVQLEVGSIATPYERQIYSDQLAQCQRYYYRISSSASINYAFYGNGLAQSTDNLQLFTPLPVAMRVAPTSLETSAMSTFYWRTGTATGTTPTSIVINTTGCTTTTAYMDIAKTGAYTSGGAAYLLANNSSSSYLGFNAEL